MLRVTQPFDLQFAMAAQATASSAFLTGPVSCLPLEFYNKEDKVAKRNEGAKMREQQLQAADVEDTR